MNMYFCRSNVTNLWIIHFEAIKTPSSGLHDTWSERSEKIFRSHEHFKHSATFVIRIDNLDWYYQTLSECFKYLKGGKIAENFVRCRIKSETIFIFHNSTLSEPKFFLLCFFFDLLYFSSVFRCRLKKN